MATIYTMVAVFAVAMAVSVVVDVLVLRKMKNDVRKIVREEMGKHININQQAWETVQSLLEQRRGPL